MKSHAKASFAGSDTSAGVAASRRAHVVLLTFLALAFAACLLPTSVLASIEGHEYKKSFGPDGTETTQFGIPGPIAVDEGSHDVYVTDLQAGTLSKFDEGGNPTDFSALASNEISGFSFLPSEAVNQIAVDNGASSPSHHDIYVAEYAGVIKAYKANGEAAEFSEGPGAGSNEIGGFGELCGVAVDKNGFIYGGDFGEVRIFKPSGEELTSFTDPEACNIAVDSQGAVYAAQYFLSGGKVEKFVPSEFPVTSTTTYEPDTSIGESSPGANDGDGIVDPGPAFALATDPASDDLYVDERGADLNHSRIANFDKDGEPIVTFAESGPGELFSAEGLASEGVAVDGASENVYASNPLGGTRRVEIFAAPPKEPPTVVSTDFSDATSSSANLEAQVDPELFDTHYHFEYLSEAQYQENGETFAGAQSTASTDLSSSGEPQSAHAHIGGLTPDTTYRFRVVAENVNGTTTSAEPPPRLTTFAAFPPGLPDGRAYEMVSPPVKVGEVFPLEPNESLGGSCPFECLPGGNSVLMPMQSTPDGEAIVYEGQAFSSGLASGPNEYLSNRSPDGWTTQSLTPLLSGEGEGQGYTAFSSDLKSGVIFQVEPALSPEAPSFEGKSYANLYLRAADGTLHPLVTEAPPNRDPGRTGANVFSIVFAGANSGSGSAATFSHLIFEANDALTEEVSGVAPQAPVVAAGESCGFAGADCNLYERVEGELRLVNVLPGNAAAASGTVIGSGRLLAEFPANENPVTNHAISADGERIFWSERPSGQVFVRIGGVETRKIEDPGKFLTASADGSQVLLNDGCLYDVEAEECEDLTEGLGGFEGTAGATEDLSTIYFVDTAALTPVGEENENGEHAEAGKFNLYLWQEGTRTFVGALREADDKLGLVGRYGAWKPQASQRTAQVSPGGRYLAFMSFAPLSGYDNTFRGGGKCKGSATADCYQVFEYDAASGKLTCASCNPSTHRPLGPSNLSLIRPGPGFPLPQPHNLATDGKGRLFFESQDVLSPYDSNGHIQDVYEWEPNGVGECKRAGGCVFLISSGHSTNDSMFLNATPIGDDAFFVTREQLALADKDEKFDLYDARVGGGIPSETETLRSECQGEACQPAAAVPNDPTPSSSAFHGAGNVKEKQKHKRHKNRHKRHAKERQHKRAAHTNRGGTK